ncbi:MAG: TIGR00730 family Rossman fold protein [Candidatus Zixiibacteriota bacterium]
MADHDTRKHWWDDCPSYILANRDTELLDRDELRPVRLQLELLKPELVLSEHNIKSTIVVFGGTRIVEKKKAQKRVEAIEKRLKKNPKSELLKRRLATAKNVLSKSHYYDEAREFARIVSKKSQRPIKREYVIVTGGGPGIMEAANRGAHESRAVSIGLNITLPMEQKPNKYITRDLCFRFRYFAIRKMHFLLRAKALIAFPGGYGTMDELFEALTLVQTHKVKHLPIILFGTEYWKKLVDFDFMVAEGTIDPDDIKLFRFCDTAEDAWQKILNFYDREDAANNTAEGL